MMSAQRRPVCLDDPGIESSTVLDGSFLRLVVDVYDAESLRVAVAPFVIVEERPGIVSAEIHSLLDRIMDTFTMLGSKTRSKSAHVSTKFADDLSRAYAVGAELNQVWMNLIDNALDAITTGGHVSVSALNEGESIVVTIADDGPGIPTEIQGRIFDPFFTTKPVGEGTGLGLDVVRRLLQQHNGSIALESSPGRTVFQVKLPAEHPTTDSTVLSIQSKQESHRR